MRDLWYGDSRDLVKWSVLLHLARAYESERIIQVAYLRPNTWPSVEIDGRKHPLPPEVIRHFRDVRNIAQLKPAPEIQVLDLLYSDREEYLQTILRTIAARSADRCLVFLDPDTGLESANPRLEHVLKSEVREIWRSMRRDDVLVFYQHQTNRAGKPWIEPKRVQLTDALGLMADTVKVALAPRIARDVVFLYCQKETQHVASGGVKPTQR